MAITFLHTDDWEDEKDVQLKLFEYFGTFPRSNLSEKRRFERIHLGWIGKAMWPCISCGDGLP